MRLRFVFLVAAALSGAHTMVFAQECRDPVEATQADTAAAAGRRAAAVRYVVAMHEMQQRVRSESGRYAPLHAIRQLPDLPVGFVPRLVVDQWGYVITVSDLLDASGFSLVSDDRQVIHEAFPRRKP